MVEYCVSRLGGSIGCTGTWHGDTMMILMSKCFQFTSREPERLKDKLANVMNFCIKVCWHYNYQVPKQGEPTKEAVYYWFCTICISPPTFTFISRGIQHFLDKKVGRGGNWRVSCHAGKVIIIRKLKPWVVNHRFLELQEVFSNYLFNLDKSQLEKLV